MGKSSFRQRRLFSLFSSIFVSLLTTILLTKQNGAVVNAAEDMFTALSKWETVIRIEHHFVGLLEKYLEEGRHEDITDQDSVKVLQKFLKVVKPNSDQAITQPEQFVSHPVNSFLVIKRFTSDWREVLSILTNLTVNGTLPELASSIDVHKPLLPTYADLKGAIDGIFRLQYTYNITAHVIASGKLSRRFPNATLDTEDCFQIGLMAYHDKDFETAKEWMKESLKRNNPNIYSSYLNRRVLLEYIAWCEYETRHLSEALMITKQVLSEESAKNNEISSSSPLKQMTHPKYASAKKNLQFFENVLKNGEYKAPTVAKKSKYDNHEYMQTYRRLCQGKSKKTSLELAKLLCYYDTKSTPELFIKPAKIEVLNMEPRIVKYKDFISDKDIATIKKLASPKLQRATINNIQTGQLEFAKYRISKSAWIADTESDTVDRLSEKITSFTGLVTEWPRAEEMQVANYGIGGHYEPHYDHATNDKASLFYQDNGNRIATFLIYMSDVESGGSTVFLSAETIVKPTKGDAVFWYNLRRSGAGDSTTRHAACPVIVGSKWVSNKWIHSFGQEFVRRCPLTYDGLPGEQVLIRRNPQLES